MLRTKPSTPQTVCIYFVRSYLPDVTTLRNFSGKIILTTVSNGHVPFLLPGFISVRSLCADRVSRVKVCALVGRRSPTRRDKDDVVLHSRETEWYATGGPRVNEVEKSKYIFHSDFMHMACDSSTTDPVIVFHLFPGRFSKDVSKNQRSPIEPHA